jgi:hypothetical protein
MAKPRSKPEKRSKFVLQIPVDVYPELAAYLTNAPRGMAPKLVTKFLLQNLISKRLPGLDAGFTWDELQAGMVDLKIPAKVQEAKSESDKPATPVGDGSATPVKKSGSKTQKAELSGKEKRYLSSMEDVG